MKKILFINADSAKPRCAVFQAGKIYADAMKFCKEIELAYFEFSSVGGFLPSPVNPIVYDAVIFNYQHVTMQHIPPAYFSHCPVAIGFLYEARSDPFSSPMHIPGLQVGQLFDVLISPDPTLDSNPKVWGVPRVIPRLLPESYKAPGNAYPVISTFGFPSPWKNLEGVIDMINAEFGNATFRLNFAPASHQEGTVLQKQQIDSAMDLRDLAGPGIKIEITQDYKTDEELVKWLAESDLNVFLSYPERGIQTGGALLASADMAISAQRPLFVSNNIEARHLEWCDFPTLTMAIDRGEYYTRRLYDLWSPENFAKAMDERIRDYYDIVA